MEINRKLMIDWCVLITGYSNHYFQRMTDEDLNTEYQKAMGLASDEILKHE